MLKQEYLKSLEKPNMVIVVGDNIESVEKTSENTSDVNENESYKQVKESFEDPGLDWNEIISIYFNISKSKEITNY